MLIKDSSKNYSIIYFTYNKKSQTMFCDNSLTFHLVIKTL
jgi:hypothetical protein